MSYSRWSHSHWYAYSDVNMINAEPTLTIQGVGSWPLSVVKSSPETILSAAEKYGEPNEQDMTELKNIFARFICDYESNKHSLEEQKCAHCGSTDSHYDWSCK